MLRAYLLSAMLLAGLTGCLPSDDSTDNEGESSSMEAPKTAFFSSFFGHDDGVAAQPPTAGTADVSSFDDSVPRPAAGGAASESGPASARVGKVRHSKRRRVAASNGAAALVGRP